MLDRLRVAVSRILGWLTGRRDAGFDDELEAHLAMLIDENLRRGLPVEEARRDAHVRLGNSVRLRETHRELQSLPWIETTIADARHAHRSLRKDPTFTLVAILTLALGIGASTAIFSVVNAVLLRPLRYSRPGELVTWRGNESQLDIDDIRAQSGRFFAAGGGVNPETLDYTGGTEPVGVHAGYVDAGLFQALAVPAMLGRTFAPEEDREGGPRTVVLTYAFWRDYLASDPNIVGTTLPLSGNSYTVIGVMPASFAAPEYSVDLFVSLRVVYAEAAKYRGVHFMRSYWRLKPGVTLSQAAAGMAVVDARLAADFPAEEKGRHTVPVPLQQWVTGDVRSALWVLFGSVCVVLLIACANFAGLLMARTVTRRREMVIRTALGGGRSRLIRQALTESTVLAAFGGAAGLLVANVGTRLLVAVKPPSLAYLNGISIDSAVLLFALTIATLTGLLFGLAPAWTASTAHAADALKQEGRTATAGPAGQGFRNVLVVAEIGLALILLAGAGLLLKSFARLSAVDPGFDAARVIAVPIQLPATRYAEIPTQVQFRRDLLAGLNRLPGVRAAMVGDAPLDGNEVSHSMAIEGRPPVAPGDEPEVDTSCVMGDYFRLMRIPLRGGRAFTDMDREGQPLVAVVNESLARQFFAGRNPVGQRVRFARETGAPRWMTIVGVAADVKQYSLAEPPYPAVFTPFAQTNENWRRWMTVVVRMPDLSASVIPAVKDQVWSLDSQIPLNRIRSMSELVELSLAARRFTMLLVTLFASLAMALASVGVYGVMSYSVSQRTHEIGIRVAIGALRSDVWKLVMARGLRLAAAGSAVGVVGALALTRLMRSLLFGVAATDPATFAVVALLMMAVVMLACFVPTWRAMRIDPMMALRDE